MIYILGGSGHVGQAYQRALVAADIPFRSIKRSELDYTDAAVLEASLRAERPDFLINAAGFVGKPNVDACEIQKTDCLIGNAVLPGRIAQACKRTGVPWGHVSSGCIFTGARADGTPFTEEDEPNFTFRQNNCSFYSGCKALGEEVLAGEPEVYVWRLRIPFNQVDGHRNYLSKLMRYDRLLDAANSISHLDEFCSATLDCWLNKVEFGTYNVTNPGHISAPEITKLLVENGLTQKSFEFFDSEEQFMQGGAVAQRSNCIMSSQKLADAGIRMTPVHDSIRQALANWQPELNPIYGQ